MRVRAHSIRAVLVLALVETIEGIEELITTVSDSWQQVNDKVLLIEIFQ